MPRVYIEELNDYLHVPPGENVEEAVQAAIRTLKPSPGPQLAPTPAPTPRTTGAPPRAGLLSTLKDIAVPPPSDIPEVVGGIVGPMMFPSAPILAAGLGAMTGRGLTYLAQKATGTADKTIYDVPHAFGRGVFGEAMGKFIGPAIRTGLSPILGKRVVSPDVEAAEEVLGPLLRPHKVPALTGAEISRSRWWDMLQNLAEGGITGGRFHKYKLLREKLLGENVINDLVNRVGPIVSWEALGEAILTQRTTKREVSRRAVREMYERLRSEIDIRKIEADLKDVRNSIPPTDLAAAEEKVRLGIPLSTSDQMNLAVGRLGLRETEEGVVEEKANLNTLLSYRSQLLSRIREIRLTTKDDVALQTLNRTVHAVDQTIEDALAKESKDLVHLWRSANRATAQNAALFDNLLTKRLVRRSVELSPRDAAQWMVKDPNRIRAVWPILEERERQFVRRAILEDILAKSRSKTTGILIGKEFLDRIQDRSGRINPILKEAFTEEQIRTIQKVARTARAIQTKPETGLMRIAIQFAGASAARQLAVQTAAVAGIVGAGYAAGTPQYGYALAGMTMAVPALAARILTSPTLARAFTKVWRWNPEHIDRSVQAAVHFGNLWVMEELDVHKEEAHRHSLYTQAQMEEAREALEGAVPGAKPAF